MSLDGTRLLCGYGRGLVSSIVYVVCMWHKALLQSSWNNLLSESIVVKLLPFIIKYMYVFLHHK